MEDKSAQEPTPTMPGTAEGIPRCPSHEEQNVAHEIVPASTAEVKPLDNGENVLLESSAETQITKDSTVTMTAAMQEDAPSLSSDSPHNTTHNHLMDTTTVKPPEITTTITQPTRQNPKEEFPLGATANDAEEEPVEMLTKTGNKNTTIHPDEEETSNETTTTKTADNIQTVNDTEMLNPRAESPSSPPKETQLDNDATDDDDADVARKRSSEPAEIQDTPNQKESMAPPATVQPRIEKVPAKSKNVETAQALYRRLAAIGQKDKEQQCRLASSSQKSRRMTETTASKAAAAAAMPRMGEMTRGQLTRPAGLVQQTPPSRALSSIPTRFSGGEASTRKVFQETEQLGTKDGASNHNKNESGETAGRPKSRPPPAAARANGAIDASLDDSGGSAGSDAAGAVGGGGGGAVGGGGLQAHPPASGISTQEFLLRRTEAIVNRSKVVAARTQRDTDRAVSGVAQMAAAELVARRGGATTAAAAASAQRKQAPEDWTDSDEEEDRYTRKRPYDYNYQTGERTKRHHSLAAHPENAIAGAPPVADADVMAQIGEMSPAVPPKRMQEPTADVMARMGGSFQAAPPPPVLQPPAVAAAPLVIQGQALHNKSFVVEQATELVCRALLDGPWPSVTNFSIVAAALHKFASDIIVPALMAADPRPTVMNDTPIILGTLLMLREALVLNADMIFGLEEVVQEETRGRRSSQRDAQSEYFAATTLATSVILAALDSLDEVSSRTYSAEFARLLGSYEDGQGEFARLISAEEDTDSQATVLLPNGSPMLDETRDAWLYSHRWHSQSHPSVLARRYGPSVRPMEPNAVHISVIREQRTNEGHS